jgi:hypothetical protein
MKQLTPKMKALMSEMMRRNKEDIEKQWAYINNAHTQPPPDTTNGQSQA